MIIIDCFATGYSLVCGRSFEFYQQFVFYQGNISSWFSSHSEAFASEWLEHLEEMFP